MLASLALFSLLSPGFAPQTQRVVSLTGRFERVPFRSKVLDNERELVVYLPPMYESEPKRRFPVLYLHDGQNVFDGATSYLPNREWRADEAAESLIGAGLIEPIVMVGIPNMGVERANEYLPTRARMGSDEAGGKADLYTKMLAEEIKPMIDARFRTKPDRRNTATGGSSFGGIVTLHIGLTRPDVFGKLLVVSPSVWWDGRTILKAVERFEGPKPKVWIDMGTQEGGPRATQDARDLYAAFQKKGWRPKRDVVYVEEGFAQHNEDAWARRFPSMLQYLFGR